MSAEFSTNLAVGGQHLTHHWKYSLGSGHARLALRVDWLAQLSRCRKELGTRHVRFHGILDDDVGTLVFEKGQPLYSFFNSDTIYRQLEGIGVSPLVALSFMPHCLASGETTVFHYAGNVTPPKQPEQWTELIGNLVGHWHRQFGREVLGNWLFEVWNEPNLNAFWTGSRDAYFQLYERTARAIKSVSPELQVGGPATAKNEWLPEFTAYCQAHDVPFDFVSTHTYPTDAFGKASDDTVAQLAKSDRHAMREQASRARAHAFGKPLYLTEWSITSNPRDPMHDQPIAAAFVLKSVLEMSPYLTGSSWWTFSDIFEENYFPSQPFQGGFGLLSIHGIAKPSYRALQVLRDVGDMLMTTIGSHPTIDCFIVQGRQRLDILVTNLVLPEHPGTMERVNIRLSSAIQPSRISVRRIDDDHANAQSVWVEMGKPDYPTSQQLERLHIASELTRENVAWTWNAMTLEVMLEMPVNGVAAITCEYPVDMAVLRMPDSQRHEHQEPAENVLLDEIQRDTYGYFLKYSDRTTGLVRDSSAQDAAASIAATGMGLACYPLAVERGYISRSDAAEMSLKALRYLLDAPHGPEHDATGYHGFYYHFLNPVTGRRARSCELSTIDTAIVIAGGLMAGRYFSSGHGVEKAIRMAAEELYARADWNWARHPGGGISHGWNPITGFLPQAWEGYCEALIMQILALGSPSHPVDAMLYQEWTRTYTWKTCYGLEYLYAGPLFIHQLSHSWIDFREIRDAPMRDKNLNYFENSRRATQIQQHYAMENPHHFKGYGQHVWGITASEGPGPKKLAIDGIERTFQGYDARGAPFGFDDGTVAPWAVMTSLPFAPDIVLPTIRAYTASRQHNRFPSGMLTTYNPTFPLRTGGWESDINLALNQGPMLLMIENHRSGLPWKLMRQCDSIVKGLRRAGFEGGWLEHVKT